MLSITQEDYWPPLMKGVSVYIYIYIILFSFAMFV